MSSPVTWSATNRKAVIDYVRDVLSPRDPDVDFEWIMGHSILLGIHGSPLVTYMGKLKRPRELVSDLMRMSNGDFGLFYSGLSLLVRENARYFQIPRTFDLTKAIFPTLTNKHTLTNNMISNYRRNQGFSDPIHNTPINIKNAYYLTVELTPTNKIPRLYSKSTINRLIQHGKKSPFTRNSFNDRNIRKFNEKTLENL